MFSTSLWNGLAASGVEFIPADYNAVRVAIAANPSAFGFLFVGASNGSSAIVGTRVDLGPGIVGIGSFTSDFGQDRTTSFGGQLGLNVAF